MSTPEPRRTASMLSFGRFTLNALTRTLDCDGEPVEINSRALDILLALAEQPGEVVPLRTLISRAWHGLLVEEANVRVHVAALRRILLRALGPGNHITNVRGRGYVLTLPVEQVPDLPAQREEARLRLPSRPAALIGRERDLDRLIELVRTHRLVSLAGPGGIGKTALAIEAMHRLVDHFDGRIRHLDLTDVTAGDLPAAIAAQLGIDRAGQVSAPLNGPGPVLFVLDSCDHHIDAVAALASAMQHSAPAAHFLLCAREATRVEGEHILFLERLRVADRAERRAAAIVETPAGQLFMASARAGGHHLLLDDRDAPSVARICNALDGNPLAIEIIAYKVSTIGIGGIASLMENPDWLLRQGWRSGVSRHRNLRTMLSWSCACLPDRVRLVLSRLSVFPASFTLAEAEAVVVDDDVTALDLSDAITCLLECSLVRSAADGNGASYRLGRLIRAHAFTQLRDSEAFGELHDRHALRVEQTLELIV
jgi:predicted ATPase/DNA-binding winged helix-turn-helix (wHTH) protein